MPIFTEIRESGAYTALDSSMTSPALSPITMSRMQAVHAPACDVSVAAALEAGREQLSARKSAEKKIVASEAPHVALMGIPIDNLTMEQALDRIESLIERGGYHQIATANSDFLIRATKDEELHEILCRCEIVVADGMPLIWASQILGSRLKGRVTGADMVPQLAQLAERKRYRIFLLGASESSSAGTAEWFEKNHPGAVLCGRYCPEHKPLEDMDHEDILQRIEAARPDILLVAFGNPKQEKWLAMHRGRLTVPVCIGVGASFDFLAGNVRRAPEWMQKSGLEWLGRTIQEPKRLAGRYAKNALGLLRHLPYYFVMNSLQRNCKNPGRFTVEQISTTTVLRVQGNLSAHDLNYFEEKSRKAFEEGYDLVVDLSRLDRLSAETMGSLIRVVNEARNCRAEFWLTGLSTLHKMLLKAMKNLHGLRFAPTVNEALRRIEPSMSAQLDEENQWIHYKIGERTLPVRTSEIGNLYLQVRESVVRMSR